MRLLCAATPPTVVSQPFISNFFRRALYLFAFFNVFIILTWRSEVIIDIKHDKIMLNTIYFIIRSDALVFKLPSHVQKPHSICISCFLRVCFSASFPILTVLWSAHTDLKWVNSILCFFFFFVISLSWNVQVFFFFSPRKERAPDSHYDRCRSSTEASLFHGRNRAIFLLLFLMSTPLATTQAIMTAVKQPSV